MKLTKTNWIGIGFGVLVLIVDLIFFMREKIFFFLVGISLGVIVLPFILTLALSSKREEEIGEMFLEFSRNLSESVAMGTPIGRSIMNLSKKQFGALTPYVRKLSAQIEMGVPVRVAMKTFAKEVDNPVVGRAISLMSEAERAGGEIDYILESVAKSIAEVEKLKKERKAMIYNLVVQGYIIFIIFIGIMLVMEFKILPLTSGLGSFGSMGDNFLTQPSASAGMNSGQFTPGQFSQPLLYLLMAQGLFAGLVIGKIAEGSIKAGIKHSFILVILAFLISTGAKALLG